MSAPEVEVKQFGMPSVQIASSIRACRSDAGVMPSAFVSSGGAAGGGNAESTRAGGGGKGAPDDVPNLSSMRPAGEGRVGETWAGARRRVSAGTGTAGAGETWAGAPGASVRRW